MCVAPDSRLAVHLFSTFDIPLVTIPIPIGDRIIAMHLTIQKVVKGKSKCYQIPNLKNNIVTSSSRCCRDLHQTNIYNAVGIFIKQTLINNIYTAYGYSAHCCYPIRRFYFLHFSLSPQPPNPPPCTGHFLTSQTAATPITLPPLRKLAPCQPSTGQRRNLITSLIR